MRLLGNIVWLVFGGILFALEYFLASLLFFITIIGIPFGLQTLKLAKLALWPFGSEITEAKNASGCLRLIMNVLWLFTFGIPIALSHFVFGALLCATVIGIPFGVQNFKLALVALLPFGREIVPRQSSVQEISNPNEQNPAS